MERRVKNVELFNRLLDQELIDFDEERKNSYEKCDVKITKEHNLRLDCQGIGQNWSPTNPEPRKDSN